LSRYLHKEIFRRQSGGKLKKQQYHISFAGLEFFAALRIEELSLTRCSIIRAHEAKTFARTVWLYL
jgi:hypothetical protein